MNVSKLELRTKIKINYTVITNCNPGHRVDLYCKNSFLLLEEYCSY